MRIHKNYLFLLLLPLFVGNAVVFAQQQKKIVFPLVPVPDSVRYALACAEAGKNHLEGHDSLNMAVNIINLESPKDYVFKDGIYTWSVLGPHFERKIFIRYKGKLQIFGGTNINRLLQEYVNYLKNSDLSDALRIKYLGVISLFLREDYENEHGKIDGKQKKKK